MKTTDYNRLRLTIAKVLINAFVDEWCEDTTLDLALFFREMCHGFDFYFDPCICVLICHGFDFYLDPSIYAMICHEFDFFLDPCINVEILSCCSH